MPKIAKKAPAKKTGEIEDVIAPAKIKKEIDLEVIEPVASDKDDDVESVPVVSEDGDDAEEEAEIDPEEVNPFGDKWEE